MGITVQTIVKCDNSHCDKTMVLQVPIESLSAKGIENFLKQEKRGMSDWIAVGDKIYCDDFCADPENEY